MNFKKVNRICRVSSKRTFNFFRKKRHENTTHLNIRELKCEKCDFTTNRPGHLKTHKESIHEGIMYDCDHPGCVKSYNLKRNLDAHRWTSHKIPKPIRNYKKV